MTLAVMLSTDEDALVCDFAEYYHIYSWRELPVSYAATLACGLRSDSRIKMALSGSAVSIDTLISAATLDRLSILVWMNSKDGEKGKNRPDSVVELLQTVNDDRGFKTASDFEAYRAKIIGGGLNG